MTAHPLSRLAAFARPYRRNAVLATVYSVLNKFFDVLPELLIGVAVDVVVNQKQSFLAKLGIAAGLADVVGSTQEIEGRLTLNLDDLSAPLGENTFTVKMNTFTTDQNDRDNWIRENGPRFNDYPVATFTATSIEGAPAAYNEGEEVSFKLSGDLTIREITQPAAFDVTASLRGDTLTGVATTRLKMSDFGIEPPNFANTLTVADEFGIEVQITAKEE